MSIKKFTLDQFRKLIMYQRYSKQIKLLRELQELFRADIFRNSLDDIYYIEEEIWKINRKIIELGEKK